MLIEKFEQQVKKNPGKIAVKTIEKAYTYDQLNRDANRIAAIIAGSWPRNRHSQTVGLLFHHDVNMIAAVLGVLKAGKAYVPLSPDYPVNRLVYMLTDSESVLILTETSCEDMARNLSQKTNIDYINIANYPGEEKKNPVPGNGEKLAYIMYTSGSTGKPKGVMQNQVNAYYYIRNWIDIFAISASDRMTLFSSFCHDGSVQDMFAALLSGATLYPFHMKNRGDNEHSIELSEFLLKERITIWHSVPSLYSFFVNSLTGNEIFADTRFILLGGEPVREHDIRIFNKYFPNSIMANVYGQTESSVNSIWLIPPGHEFNKLIIGNPLDETKIFLIDENSREADPFEIGEIVVASPYISPGYWKNDEAAQKHFSQDPELGTLYWTGDLGCLQLDGSIEFIGRKDSQVKVRGYRIELGEIETRLLSHENIKEAIVIAGTDDSGDTFLSAYIVSLREIETPVLREYLAQELPDYMIPSYFVLLEKMPLTRSGKIDRNVLPAPGPKPGRQYVAPGDSIEEKLVQTWGIVLGIEKEKISIHDNFFELGGHSLKATTLVAKIHKELNIKIPVAQVFQTMTIKGLAGYIREAKQEKYISIAAVEKKEYYALSPAQTRLYFLQQMEENSTGYNMSLVALLQGPVDVKKLEDTFKKLIRRHDSLRTSFSMIEPQGKPVQEIRDRLEFQCQYHDMNKPIDNPAPVTHHSSRGGKNPGSPAPPASIDALIRDFIRPFNLVRAPLLRAGLIKLEERKHILMVDTHHIISDGTSHALLIREFAALYESIRLNPLRIHYKDYSEWQNRLLETGEIKKQEAYWLKEFNREVPVLNLPIDYPRPMQQTFAGSSIDFDMGSESTAALNKLALKEEVTLYMVLSALYAIMLAKTSGQDTIIMGTPIAGRRHADSQHIIGMFLNMLAIKTDPEPGEIFTRFLRQVKDKTLNAYENQDYQFEELVEKLALKRDISRHPVFDVMFNFINIEVDASDIPRVETADLYLGPYGHENRTTKFDLTLKGRENAGNLFLTFEYRAALFKRETIEKFISYFRLIAATVLKEPQQHLSKIEIISPQQKQEILNRFNASLESMKPMAFQDRLLESIRQHPHQIAVEYGQEHITYRQLEKNSHGFTLRIKAHALEKESCIGICLNNKIDIISALVGILKAACVCVPLDPAHPAKRIISMIKIADLKMIFLDPGNRNRFSPREINGGTGFETVIMEDTFSRQNPSLPQGAENPGRDEDENWYKHYEYNPQDRVYIYFTSGSTGAPKAIVGKSISLLHFVDWEIRTFLENDVPTSPAPRFSQFTAVGFDVFLRDILVPLCAGGMVCIPGSKEIVTDREELVKWIDTRKINILHCVPGFFKLFNTTTLNERNFKHLKAILFAGEKVNPNELRNWYEIFKERIQLVNLYGPTETTLAKLFYFIRQQDVETGIIPIGKPIDNTRVIVLDKNMNICDTGIEGEIYIRTPYRTYGYLNAPQLNQQRFIPNPFAAGHSSDDYIYRTGDIGKSLPDGNILWLGRVDRQVKIRGIRVELEEIENHLVKLEGIKEAVVANTTMNIPGSETGTRDKSICAYIVSDKKYNKKYNKKYTVSELREHLSANLPDYMIPTHIVHLDRIPLTANGKINREALPLPGIETVAGYTPPRDEIELKMEQVWSYVLGIKKEQIGVKKDFFQLGGNSLKAIILVSAIHKELHAKIPLTEVFKNPTVRGLSSKVKIAVKDKYISLPMAEKRDYYSLSSAQGRLFILQQMEPANVSYNMLRVVVMEGEIDEEKLEQVFLRLIKRHESLRTSFRMLNHEPVQEIHWDVLFEIEHYNGIGGQEPVEPVVPMGTGKEIQIETGTNQVDTIINTFIRPFDLARAPLMRAGLIKLQEKKQILMVDTHHIVSDGTSHAVLMQEFAALYQGMNLKPLRIQYKDYSQWQKHNRGKNALESQKDYWIKELKGKVPLLNLPVDYERPEIQDFTGSRLTFEIGKHETGELNRIAQTAEATLFVVMLTIFNIFLAKICGQEEIVVGTPTAGRRHHDLQSIIGMFVNTLVMKNCCSMKTTFSEFLNQVKARTWKAFDNQDYQFDDLVEQVLEEREPGRNPLFDVMFILQNIEVQAAGIPQNQEPGLQVEPYGYKREYSVVDLTFICSEIGEQLVFLLQYNTRLFRKEKIERFIKYFREIVSAVVKNRTIRLEDIVISHELSATGKKILLQDQGDFAF